MKPFLKWPGGKTQLLPELSKHYPAKGSFSGYHEPFIGGGAVFFDLSSRGLLEDVDCHLSDDCGELVNAYQVVRDHVHQLIRELRKHEEGHAKDPKDHYYATRAAEPTSKLARAARLIYLNKTCFPAGSKILLENESVIDIETVKVGDRLWGGRVVKKCLKRRFDGTLIGPKVQGWGVIPHTTEDHPILRVPAAKGRQETRSVDEMLDQVELAEAKDLRKRDLILQPRFGIEKPIDWIRFWPKLSEMGPQAGSRDFRPNDQKISRFLGYYLADGYNRLREVAGPRGGRGGQVTIVSCTDAWPSTTGKQSMVDDLLDIGQSVFGVKPDVKIEQRRVTVTFTSSHLARFIERLIPGQTWSKDEEKYHTKHLSDALMTADASIQLSLLYGWFMGDSSLKVDQPAGRVELAGTTVIPELARQLHRIATRCGFRPSWRVYTPNGITTQVVTMGIAEEVKKLGFKVPVPNRKPCSRRRFLGDYIGARVMEVHRVEACCEVFNLEVGGDHLLCVDGVISHNCFNGLYRVNQDGKFNSPMGDYKKPAICDTDNLLACSRVLEKGADLPRGLRPVCQAARTR